MSAGERLEPLRAEAALVPALQGRDGEFYAVPPQGGAVRPNEGPVSVGLFRYRLSEQSARVRAAADDAMRRIPPTGGRGASCSSPRPRGAHASHPLGGCRMAESPDLGLTDHAGPCSANEGLHCIDSSIVPTSLGVNPSLTIAALSERCAEALVARGADLGLPARPPDLRHRRPRRIVGERVVGPAERRSRRRHGRPH